MPKAWMAECGTRAKRGLGEQESLESETKHDAVNVTINT